MTGMKIYCDIKIPYTNLYFDVVSIFYCTLQILVNKMIMSIIMSMKSNNNTKEYNDNTLCCVDIHFAIYSILSCNNIKHIFAIIEPTVLKYTYVLNILPISLIKNKSV